MKAPEKLDTSTTTSTDADADLMYRYLCECFDISCHSYHYFVGSKFLRPRATEPEEVAGRRWAMHLLHYGDLDFTKPPFTQGSLVNHKKLKNHVVGYVMTLHGKGEVKHPKRECRDGVMVSAAGIISPARDVLRDDLPTLPPALDLTEEEAEVFALPAQNLPTPTDQFEKLLYTALRHAHANRLTQ
jgi:hypothetical protein